ncbi:ABC transporter ATP-binding protein, partial [Piscirickettsia salmonis]|uniref:ABC transporter ATP-binding protein n=1 Tax=Piscirickettsia salmonis TaxID=1238 RepID=UPI00211D97C0
MDVGSLDEDALVGLRRRIGMIFQHFNLLSAKTVAQNVALPLRVAGVKPAEARAKVDALLDLVGLRDKADTYPSKLSGGQQQRVAIGRALVYSPPVILLDEPLSNLDAKLREDMQFELRSIQKQIGTTTVMVTHDQAEALSISDRVVVMQDGRATQVDAPYRMYEHPQSEFISRFVGKTNLLPGRVTRCGAQ